MCEHGPASRHALRHDDASGLVGVDLVEAVT
jgi:hypothetical protein